MEKAGNNSPVCRICFTSGRSVCEATGSVLTDYYTIIDDQMPARMLADVYLCVMCSALVVKTMKFVRFCRLSSLIIREAYDRTSDGPTLAFPKVAKRRCYELSASEVLTYDYVPELSACTELNSDKLKREEKWEGSDCGDLPQIDFSDDEDVPLGLLKKEIDSMDIEEVQIGELDKEYQKLDSHMRGKRRKKKKRTNGVKLEIKLETHMETEKLANLIKEEINIHKLADAENCPKARVRRPAKEGFSSRMITETNEYTVIKLTKEQVLQEMRERAGCERFLTAPFKCDLCVKWFNFEDVLKKHMERHTTESGSLLCELCSQYCPSVVSMRGHIKSHTTRYRCKVCGEVRLSRQHLLEHHALSHSGVPCRYVCSHCEVTCTKRTVFQKHMRTHFPAPPRPCDQCGKLFKSIETLRAHMLRHTDVKRFACEKCSRTFLYASLLHAHRASHTTQRDFYCVECDVRFKSQANLRMHFRRSAAHRDPEMLKYQCDQCEKRLVSASALWAHAASAHGAAKRHACAMCPRAYGAADGLRAHVRRAHRGIHPPKNHICDVCSKAFRAKAVLVKHIRVHTGERPYACGECGVNFAQAGTRATHVRLVHRKLPRTVRKTHSTTVQ